MKNFVALLLIAACALSTGARGQNTLNSEPPSACPEPQDVSPLHLYGLWRAEFVGSAQGATLLFEKHAEYAGSVSGGVNRDGDKALVAGDVDDGVFTLEESVDGHSISATWEGNVVEDSCGKEIRGTWRSADGSISYPFVLRKVPESIKRP
jgi:hypothetical protein